MVVDYRKSDHRLWGRLVVQGLTVTSFDFVRKCGTMKKLFPIEIFTIAKPQQASIPTKEWHFSVHENLEEKRPQECAALKEFIQSKTQTLHLVHRGVVHRTFATLHRTKLKGHAVFLCNNKHDNVEMEKTELSDAGIEIITLDDFYESVYKS